MSWNDARNEASDRLSQWPASIALWGGKKILAEEAKKIGSFFTKKNKPLSGAARVALFFALAQISVAILSLSFVFVGAAWLTILTKTPSSGDVWLVFPLVDSLKDANLGEKVNALGPDISETLSQNSYHFVALANSESHWKDVEPQTKVKLIACEKAGYCRTAQLDANGALFGGRFSEINILTGKFPRLPAPVAAQRQGTQWVNSSDRDVGALLILIVWALAITIFVAIGFFWVGFLATPECALRWWTKRIERVCSAGLPVFEQKQLFKEARGASRRTRLKGPGPPADIDAAQEVPPSARGARARRL